MNISLSGLVFLCTVADQLERTPGTLRKTFKINLIFVHMDEIRWVLSSRSHSCYFLGDTKHGDICGVSSLIYPEMTQLCSTSGEGSFQLNTTSFA